MNVNNFFVSSDLNNAGDVVSLFSQLHELVKAYVIEDFPMLDGDISSYDSLLEGKSLPMEGRSTDNVLRDFSKLFQRCVLWQHAGSMTNITPPSNIVSIAASCYASLFNPNFAIDESSGYLLSSELIVNKYISELVGWNTEISSGVFTFGGKGTNLYAVKIGMKKAVASSSETGVFGNEYFVISNEKSHPCHIEVCDWLGIGKNNCIRLPVGSDGRVILSQMRETIVENIKKGKKLACILLNGGTTNEVIIDAIPEVVAIRDQIVADFDLDYVPHVHVDAVIGWAWLFFKFYNFDENPIGMSESEIVKIKSICEKVSYIQLADSFGADFHKTGFCPYVSSILMVKDTKDLLMLGDKSEIDNMKYGSYAPFEYTLELTRSSSGAISAYVALELFGVKGFQQLIYSVFQNSEFIRNTLNTYPEFEVINMDTEGFATLFVVHDFQQERKYSDVISSDKQEIESFVNYNQQYFLYTQQEFEKHHSKVKITFSKSYKPYGSKSKTGCLKIYNISPVATQSEIHECLEDLFRLKSEFNKFTDVLLPKENAPRDFVYRDE